MPEKKYFSILDFISTLSFLKKCLKKFIIDILEYQEKKIKLREKTFNFSQHKIKCVIKSVIF